jgi:diphthamide biosynthesis protein 3
MPQYDEIEIEDMTYDPKTLTFSYPCPCGDRFKVSLEDLWDGEDIADCNSCTLYIQVIYEKENLPPLPDNDDSDDENENENNKESLKEDDSDENDKAEEEKKEDGNRTTTSREKEVTLGMGNMTLSCSLQEEQNNNKSAVAA